MRGAESRRFIPPEETSAKPIDPKVPNRFDRNKIPGGRIIPRDEVIDKFSPNEDDKRDVFREINDELNTDDQLSSNNPEHIEKRTGTGDGLKILQEAMNKTLAGLREKPQKTIPNTELPVTGDMLLDARDAQTPPKFETISDQDIIDTEETLGDEDIDIIGPPATPENTPYLLTEKDISPGPEIPEDIHELTESDLEKIEDMSEQVYPADLKQYAEALDILDQMDLSPKSREDHDILELPKQATLAPPSPPKTPQKSSKLGRWLRNATLAIGGLFVGSRSVEHIDTAVPSSKAEISSTTQTEINNVNPSFETRQQNSTDIQKKAENSKKSSREINIPQTKEERLRESMQESTEGIDSKLASYPVIYFDTNPNNKNIKKHIDQRSDLISYRDKTNNSIYTVSPEKIHLTTFDNEGRFSKILIAHTDHKKKDFKAFQDTNATLADKTIEYEYTPTGELSRVIVSNESSSKSLTTPKELSPYFMLTKAAPTIHVSAAAPHVKERIDAAFEGTTLGKK